jgi:hypothetical protein
VNYETIYSVEGVGLANVVQNAVEVEGRVMEQIIMDMATFDDGSSWALIKTSSKDSTSNDIGCDTTELNKCPLHLHSVIRYAFISIFWCQTASSSFKKSNVCIVDVSS